MIKKIFLYSIAISCAFLLIQGIKTGFDVNSIKNKITDSIDNINNDNSNNNDNNNSGNTTNVSAYSNLVVSEQAPSDTNSIWVKSNNNITNVEYSEKALFEYSDSYSFEKFADCNNESYFNNFNQNCIIENEYIYNFTQDSSNFYIKIIDKNKNLINDITINQSHNSNYCSFAMSEDYYFILDGYNSKFYKYSRIDNSLISSKTYSFSTYSSNCYENCMYYSKNNNCLYIDFYNYKPCINIIDLTDDSLINNFVMDVTSQSSEINYKHNRFIGEFDGYIYVQSYNYLNKINIEDNSYSSVLISSYNKTSYQCIIFIKNEYIYNYSINYTNNIVSGSDNYSQCYYLSEKIFNLYDNSVVKENYYYLDSTCNGSNYYIYFDNFEENFDIYIYSYSNTSYKYLYKLSKKPVEISNNTLYINDTKYNNVFNSNPIYIKFNNVFGYKLYSPKFYLANNSGNLIKANAYKYNTSTQAWESI